ncbi:hypothetical protein BP00DRAFT_415525 [Aspergillus indologenus CBS 114.80]|uniref:Uncharacterized protein n=1 Tax=Aspergillus indologenus CBS 114.80 TaxID=1450541 RepID=A0A2V5IBN9_9EURO|nr:hypothetical protein BP00DRAFT_415525 [Aspergillus indologenus CBS 114.80]
MSVRMIFHHLKTAYRALSAVILSTWIVFVLSLVVVANVSPSTTPNIVDHLASASLFIFLVCRLIVHFRPTTSTIPRNSHPTPISKTNSNNQSLDHHSTNTTAKIIAWIANPLQSPKNQHPRKSAVLFLICSVLWLRDLLFACVLLCMLTMFSIMLFMLVVLGLDTAMTTTPDARALGLRAWTVSPPTGREDLADQWTPEMARIMAFIYEEMDKGGINPDAADQWMVTWWFKVLLGLAWLNLVGLGWYVLGLAGKALWRVLVGAPSVKQVAPRELVAKDEEKGVSGVEMVEGSGRQGGKQEVEMLRFRGEGRSE